MADGKQLLLNLKVGQWNYNGNVGISCQLHFKRSVLLSMRV